MAPSRRTRQLGRLGSLPASENNKTQPSSRTWSSTVLTTMGYGGAAGSVEPLSRSGDAGSPASSSEIRLGLIESTYERGVAVDRPVGRPDIQGSREHRTAHRQTPACSSPQAGSGRMRTSEAADG
jgi:hypothetical protein